MSTERVCLSNSTASTMVEVDQRSQVRFLLWDAYVLPPIFLRVLTGSATFFFAFFLVMQHLEKYAE